MVTHTLCQHSHSDQGKALCRPSEPDPGKALTLPWSEAFVLVHNPHSPRASSAPYGEGSLGETQSSQTKLIFAALIQPSLLTGYQTQAAFTQVLEI